MIENIFCISGLIQHIMLHFPFLHLGVCESVQAGVLDRSLHTHESYSYRTTFFSGRKLLYSVSSDCKDTKKHLGMTQYELHILFFPLWNDPQESAQAPVCAPCRGHQHISLQDQRHLCHAAQLRAKHIQRPMPLKRPGYIQGSYLAFRVWSRADGSLSLFDIRAADTGRKQRAKEASESFPEDAV